MSNIIVNQVIKQDLTIVFPVSQFVKKL
jgi:hypothetical protein